MKNPIDAFVLSRLQAGGFEPAVPADKVALVRRAYYDLIGLAPTPQQVDEFLVDRSPRAFEKVVDRLLESSQYGEKWARHWLDLVRYAETNGYERDSRKDLIWKYRDYVIRAFNEDKPFDRFVLEQLAGDELPDKDADSITATGFYRLGIWDDEPADRERARYDYLDDILRTTSETFLGMTIGCARCHDHKIDPITQRDYYSLLAFFSDISPHGKGKTNHISVARVSEQSAYDKQVTAKQKRESDLQSHIKALEDKFFAAIAEQDPDLKIQSPKRTENAKVLRDSIKNPQTWSYSLVQPAGNWFEIAFDETGWKQGPGGFGTKGTPGSVVRTTWQTPNIWLRKSFRLAQIPAKLSLNIHHDEDATVYLNGKLIASFKGHLNNYRTIDVTGQASDVLQTGRNTLAVHCRQTGGGQYIDLGVIADFSSVPLAVLAKRYGDEILTKRELADWEKFRNELAVSQSQEINQPAEFAMAVAESGRKKTWVLGRGNPSMKGEEIGPAFPQCLNPPPANVPVKVVGPTSGKRRVLAEWITSTENPTTARVMANRIWQHHFGRGLARTTSDFGFQGRPPTHPYLLDWLASEFVASGWRMKSLHKLIMMSSTYQMSSGNHEATRAKDPTNELFWRFNMRRLGAEEIRDSVLLVSGTLNLKMFGPSIYPPLPKEVLATASRPGAAWGNSSETEAARRSVYVHVKRSLRPPMMSNFDVPDTDTPCAVRMTTTVPTQALGMLNSVFMNEQSAKLLARLEREVPDDIAGQVARAIRLTAGRRPVDDEIQADLRYIEQLQKEEQLSLQAAMQHYCLMILNTNEFVYLD